MSPLGDPATTHSETGQGDLQSEQQVGNLDKQTTTFKYQKDIFHLDHRGPGHSSWDGLSQVLQSDSCLIRVGTGNGSREAPGDTSLPTPATPSINPPLAEAWRGLYPGS